MSKDEKKTINKKVKSKTVKNKKFFISYDYSEDRNHKNLMKAWSKNQKFDFKFKDESTDLSVNSKNTKYIEKCILKDIKRADVFICLIGKKTSSSKWVNWEIQKAKKLGKYIIGIFLEKGNKTPENLEKYADSILQKFDFKKIEDIISCKANYFERQQSLIVLERIKC